MINAMDEDVGSLFNDLKEINEQLLKQIEGIRYFKV